MVFFAEDKEEYLQCLTTYDQQRDPRPLAAFLEKSWPRPGRSEPRWRKEGNYGFHLLPQVLHLQKAQAWLKAQGLDCEVRDIQKTTPPWRNCASGTAKAACP